MNLEEARKVIWFKNYPKTMGELLDEGYLFQSRLEWAAEKAFVPQIKEAAKVILESKKHSPPLVKTEPSAKFEEKSANALELPIPLDKARVTLWPFAPYKGQPMGVLVESKQLSLKDLGYAIETAWDEKVRQAAIALSLIRLEQTIKEPTPDAGFVHVVSGGRSYSEKQQAWLTLLEGMVLGVLLVLIIVLSIWIFSAGFRPRSNPNGPSFSEFVSDPARVVALILVLGFFIFLYWLAISIPNQITKRLDKKIEEYRFGQEGEDQAVQAIIQALDGNWHLFRNVNLPGSNKGDLDIVLVGPPGVWVLEVKNFRGVYRNIGEKWEYRHGKKWKETSASPSRQANNNALRLKNFLKADNLNAFVNQAVVWVNHESPLTNENPSVAVWQYNRLPDELGNIWQGEKLSEAERNQISGKLSKLCERQKELAKQR